MKKRVKSAVEIRELALKRGASVKGPDGKVFNSGKVVSKAKPKPKAKPAAKPAPKTKPKETAPAPKKETPAAPTVVAAQPDPELLRQMTEITKGLKASTDVTKELASQIAVQSAVPSSVKEWVFDVERDHDGFISRITAKAEQRRLN